jgi:hypothetical protein
MTLSFLVVSVCVLLAATVLLFVGGIAEIEVATASQCDANYLCDIPQTIDAPRKLDYAALIPE